MGYMRHHAIVVTGYSEEHVSKAHAEAVRLFSKEPEGTLHPHISNVSPIIGPAINGYHSFFVGPDGSKEGWEPSKCGDDRRRKFVEWLRRSDTGHFDWAEVQYGDDEGVTKIAAHSDEDLSSKAAFERNE